MQAYQIHPLPAPARRIRRQPRLSPLDLIEPLLLLCMAPLALAPERFAPNTILLGLSVLLIPYLLRWLFYGAPSRSTLADLPLFLLLAVVTPISLWVTPYFWSHAWPEWVRMMWGGAVCLAVMNWALPLWQQPLATPAAAYRLPPRLWWLTFAYLFLGIGLGAIGLLNMDLVNKLPVIDQVAAQLKQVQVAQFVVDDSFNPNRVAALLVMFAPLPLAFLLSSGRTQPPVATGQTAALRPATRRRSPLLRLARLALQGGWRLVSKVSWLLLWLAFAGGLLLTQSRAGLIATAAGVLVVLLLTLRQPAGWLRLVGGLFFLMVVVGVSYSALSLQLDNRWLTNFFQDASTTVDKTSAKMLNTASLSGRVIIWQRALNGIADQPLTGMGLAAFDQRAYEPYPLAGYIPGDIHHAHNLFLQVGLDLGVPGLILWVALVSLALSSLVALYRAVPPAGQLSVWSVALIGCFVACIVYNCLDALTLGARPAVALWFLLGLALSARSLIPATEPLGSAENVAS
ncbi:MAG: O-antigen ligase family protein [Caldilineaceae bacterium]|nr:O-antigen ligase family protein [Caldilineaceae bacterium]